MIPRGQLLCIWSALVFGVLLFVGWWLLAGFVPPHSPGMSPETVANVYSLHTGSIRLGLMLALLGSPFYIPFGAAISAQLNRIQGISAALSYTQLACTVAVAMLLVLPLLVWTAAAFRPERSVEITQALDDLGWILLVMPAPPALVQVLSIGVAVLSDKAPQPVFPRWVGYFNLWMGVLFLPGLLLTFFKSGAFAWNGILAFWLPVLMFFLWIIVMVVQLHGGARREADTAKGAIA